MAQEEKNIPVEQQRLEKEQIEDMGSVSKSARLLFIVLSSIMYRLRFSAGCPVGADDCGKRHFPPHRILSIAQPRREIFSG